MKKNEPILIACEESGIVTSEFIKLGFTNVFSCDLIETSGNYPERHIVGDILNIINGNCSFITSDGIEHKIMTKFSLIIAFPPCTHLAVSGARHFKEKIADGRQQQGIDFFMKFANANCDKIAIENPVGIMSTKWRKPNQYIQPYEYGHSVTKKTGLWLKGLPNLKPINIVDKGEIVTFKSGKKMHSFFAKSFGDGKSRSKTFPGIAKAMATQWGEM